MLVEWRSVSTKHGELCVTARGMQQMQVLYAVNLGFSDMVSFVGCMGLCVGCTTHSCILDMVEDNLVS